MKKKTAKEGAVPKHLQNAINEMTEDEMKASLTELSESRFWVAILKYCQERALYAQQGLYTLDPFKQQTDMARFQGLLMGLSDLQNAVQALQEHAKVGPRG